MVIEQTVEIPADRRLVLDMPLPFSLTPEAAAHDKELSPLLAMCGIDRGKDTLDAYFARKRADKAREDAQIERQLHGNKPFQRE